MAINYSIKPIIRTDKPIKQNSKYPIYWLVRLNNKQVKIPAKKDVDKNDWDKAKSRLVSFGFCISVNIIVIKYFLIHSIADAKL